MKIITGLEANTKEWLEWRSTHLTATSAAIVMGMNPWQTKKQLFEEKTLGWEKVFTDKELARMNEGTRMEPIAREEFIKHTGLFVEPLLAEHSDYPFLSASFDGMSPDLQTLVEIKCGKKSFEMALNGIIPDYYRCQCMHQLLVSGLDSMYYYAFDGSLGILLEVKRENEFIDKMLEEEIKFWDCIQTFTQPED